MPLSRYPHSLQRRLLTATASGLLLVVLCALFGLAVAWRSLSVDVPPPVQHASDAQQMSQQFRLQVQEWKNVLIRGSDADAMERHLGQFDSLGRQIQQQATALAGALEDSQASGQAQQFATQHAELMARYRQALPAFIDAGHNTQLGDGLVTGVDRGPTQTLQTLVQRTQQLADAAVVERAEQSRATLRLCAIVLCVLAGLLLAALAWWLRHQVVMPILGLTSQAGAIARGELERRPALRRSDELGQLDRALDQVVQTVQGVIQAQQDMAQAHARGEVSQRIDTSAFAGRYRQMTEGSNALVDGHLGLIDELLAVMQRYAIGDLSCDLRPLPGEQASITAAMNTTKANLTAINQQIQSLAAAAIAGNFEQRGDVGAFSHAFAAMVKDLNTLMATTDDNLMQVSAVLQAIAAGHLDHRMDGDAQGVFALMRQDAARSMDNLRGMVGRIAQAAQTIDDAAGELASGNAELSQRTEQQAASLEETAASMEELTATVRQNAASAATANALVTGAADLAQRGGSLVGTVISTMGQIEQASRRIAQIIEVIDGLAFQTNLLALNAAVEAARAGDQGRGFAVVASEVRTLAQRSADAARQIRGLIDDSVQTVQAGNEQVGQAGGTMQEVVDAVARVSTLMAEISAASNEQSAGIEQVNQTIVQLDGNTQNNAALVEESTAAAAAMTGQARALMEAVAAFRLA